MKAMILAAGLGTRLRPLTDTLPKPLLPLGGRPLITYTLDWLKRFGITEVVINVHYLREKIMQTLGDGRRFGMTIVYSEEPELLGTGGGIKKAQPHLSDGAFVVVNADVLIDLDLRSVVAFHGHKGGEATLVLREDAAVQFGAIQIDRRDRIRSILAQPPWEDAAARTRMFTGVHIIAPALLDAIPTGQACSITDIYIARLKAGAALYGYTMQGDWDDLGHRDRYDQAVRARQRRAR